MSKFVYFIKPIGMDGPIKIGCSDYPSRRLAELMLWSPFPLEVAVVIPGSMKLERNIQECLIASRSHKEWFHATPSVLGLIEKLVSGVPIDEAIDLSKRGGSLVDLRSHWTEEKRAYMAAAMRRSWEGRRRRHQSPASQAAE